MFWLGCFSYKLEYISAESVSKVGRSAIHKKIQTLKKVVAFLLLAILLNVLVNIVEFWTV